MSLRNARGGISDQGGNGRNDPDGGQRHQIGHRGGEPLVIKTGRHAIISAIKQVLELQLNDCGDIVVQVLILRQCRFQCRKEFFRRLCLMTAFWGH